MARHPERPDSPSGYDRQAYPFVAFRGRQAHVFTTQDVADPVKIAAGAAFTYSFRSLQYYFTRGILAQPFARPIVVDVDSIGGWAHNDDLLIDRDGHVHLLYQYQHREGDWGDTRTVHAYGPPGGPLRHVELGAPGAFNRGASGRLRTARCTPCCRGTRRCIWRAWTRPAAWPRSRSAWAWCPPGGGGTAGPSSPA